MIFWNSGGWGLGQIRGNLILRHFRRSVKLQPSSVLRIRLTPLESLDGPIDKGLEAMGPLCISRFGLPRATLCAFDHELASTPSIKLSSDERLPSCRFLEKNLCNEFV